MATDYSYSIEDGSVTPVAVIAPASQDTIVGAVVRLDGRASFSPTGADLTFSWRFKQVPIGSQVEVDGFKLLEDDASVVSFAPDIIGLYVIELVVNDGILSSEPASSDVTTKVVLVPQNLGIVPDASWVWNYLSDFWTRVEQRDRFETIWSSTIQIVAAEQLKLWQYDYNKSIQDIQDLIQKRWLKYEPALVLDSAQVSMILAQDQAGVSASTSLIDTESFGQRVDQPSLSNLVTIPASEGNFSTTSYGSAIPPGRLLQLGEQSFTMARSGAVTRAVSIGSDGATVATGDDFSGSAFTTSMIGMNLKILSGSQAGSVYRVIAVPDSTTLTVEDLDGTSASFAATASSLRYAIYPSSANGSAFYADQNYVPTRRAGLSWRFSPTLSSTQYDFEAQGVSPGDVLTVQITRVDNQRSSNLNVQVVSVDRNRVGVVFNTEDLQDGVPSTDLSRADQIKLSDDLQVPGLMVNTYDNSLVYTDQALQVKTTVQSAYFKRTSFEKALSSTSEVNVGPFSITITPLRFIRNSKILVDSSVRAVPSLQEFVKQPEVVEKDGKLYQISSGRLFELARQPYVVYENADYVLDSDEDVTGTCSVTSGSDQIDVPYGDLVDRSIRQGDLLTVIQGVDEFQFQVLAILDPNTVRVTPTPTFSDALAKYVIKRDVPGNFIRFVAGTFTKKAPAPTRLWAEVTFFDNGDAVENNFGVLVGVLRSDLSSVGATISYKNAVAGLMYALTNGPTIANLQLSSQILLGLPFTINAGVIVEIDPEFKKNLDGSPLMGRILVNAQDRRGVLLGITNIYFYPQGRQIPDPDDPTKWVPANPELSGIAINANTGVEYRVGDQVGRFVPLSKGTQVQDYLTTQSIVQRAVSQGNASFLVQQYHSFQLIVNADFTTSTDTDLVVEFIKKAKPTYAKIALALSKALEDTVIVDDSLLFSAPVVLHDNEGFGLPVSVALEHQSVDGSYLSIEGVMYAYRIYGTDLQTTQGGEIVASSAGGFITPRANEEHDADFVRPGDLLRIKSGPNAGFYVIVSVDGDDTVTLDVVDAYGNSFFFETLTGQEFVIYMPLRGEIARGTQTVTNGATSLVITACGIGSPGLTSGDWFVFFSAGFSSRLYTVKTVDPSTGTITFQPPIEEATGSRTIVFYRDGLLSRFGGYSESDTPIELSLNDTTHEATINDSSIDRGLPLIAMPGDTLLCPATSEAFTIVDFNPAISTFYLQPALAASGTALFQLRRQNRVADTVISTDIIDRMPSDSLYLSIKRDGDGPDLTTTNGSSTVSTVSGIDFNTGLNVMVGDYLIVSEGGDSTRDIGYGQGVFPILEVSGTDLILTRPLTVTNNSPGIRYGIQRRRANER